VLVPVSTVGLKQREDQAKWRDIIDRYAELTPTC
jgi:hypothetical protein